LRFAASECGTFVRQLYRAGGIFGLEELGGGLMKKKPAKKSTTKKGK
jgi:hypothetical protein